MLKTKIQAEVAARNALNARANDVFEDIRKWFAGIVGTQFWTKDGAVLKEHKPAFGAIQERLKREVRKHPAQSWGVSHSTQTWGVIFPRSWGSGAAIWLQIFSRADYEEGYRDRPDAVSIDETFWLGDVRTDTGILESVAAGWRPMKTDYKKEWVHSMRCRIARKEVELSKLRGHLLPFKAE